LKTHSERVSEGGFKRGLNEDRNIPRKGFPSTGRVTKKTMGGKGGGGGEEGELKNPQKIKRKPGGLIKKNLDKAEEIGRHYG